MAKNAGPVNHEVQHESNLDYILSIVLRTGLLLSFSIVLCGGLFFLWQNGKETVDFHLFDGEPISLVSLHSIFEALISTTGADKILPLIQLGIIVLIATPVIRVVSCLIVFAVEQDLLYVFISGFVLAILLYTNL